VNRRKLRRRTEHAARLYSKWAMHRLMQRYVEESFARMDQWLDANPIRSVDFMHYRRAFVGGRSIASTFLLNPGA